LTKRIEEVSKDPFKLFNVPNIPYIDPKRLINRKYKLNDKSDVYSVGVLLWEISSGRSPFNNGRKAYDIGLIYQISQGARENAIPGTPDSYVKIYTGKYNFLNFIIFIFNEINVTFNILSFSSLS
jgi:hypothetical protein